MIIIARLGAGKQTSCAKNYYFLHQIKSIVVFGSQAMLYFDISHYQIDTFSNFCMYLSRMML